MKPLVLCLACLAAGTLTAAAEAPLILSNGQTMLQLDPAQHGAIVSLSADNSQFIAPQRTPRLFQLDFSPAGDPTAKRILISSRDLRCAKASKSTESGATVGRLEFTGPPDRPIEVICTFRLAQQDPCIRARIEVRFPPSLVLEFVRFPLLTLASPLENDCPQALVIGSTKGGLYRPSTFKVGQSIQFTQPGNLAAAMACFGDEDAGLLTAMFDPRGHRKMIAATRTSEGLEIAWLHPSLTRAKFELEYDAVLATITRRQQGRAVDWRDGADLYKAWAMKQPWCAKTFIQRTDLPAWLKAGSAMVRFGREWLDRPPRIKGWLREYWQPQFDSRPLIVTYWGWEKLGSWVTPDYFPCYPSDDVFRGLVGTARAIGAHTFLWPSGYHYTVTYQKQPNGSFAWDDRDRFDRQWRAQSVCGRDGKVIIADRSWLRGGQTATLCPGEPQTIELFNRNAIEMAKRGVELIQVDQVVGAGFPVCYSTTHHHPPGPGLWTTDVIRRQLETLLAECRKVQPDAVIGFEEPNEWFLQQVGIQDYRDLESLKGPVAEPLSVFGYLYHEYLPAFQSNPNRNDRLGAAYCLVNGQIPHFVPTWRSGGPLLVNGGFEDPQGDWIEGWDKVPGYKGHVYAGEAALDGKEYHSGRQSVRLRNRQPGEIVQVAQNIAVGGQFQAGRTYRLSAWLKTAGIQSATGIPLATFGPGLKPTGAWRIELPRKSGQWTHNAAEFRVPPGSEMLRIMLQISQVGTLWIDDLRLEEVAADGTVREVAFPKLPSDHDLMRQWVELFQGAGRPFLLEGKMLHPPRLQTAATEGLGRSFPAVLHNAYQAPDGSVAVILANPTDAAQAVELQWPSPMDRRSLSLQPGEVRLIKR